MHLLEENREHIEVICMLEESVKLLEKMRDSSKVKPSPLRKSL
jgi:hypothetical protein